MEINKKGAISIEDIYELLHSVNKNITEKIDEVKKDVQELSTKVDAEILEIKTKVQALQSENVTLKNSLKYTERRLLKNNLVIYGIEEREEETERDLRKTVQTLIIEKVLVELECYDITNTFRLGRKLNTTTFRPVLVEFHSSITKKEVLKNRTKLKGTNIYINEDLIEEDRKERKVLVEKLKEARRENRIASIKGNILIIDGKQFTYQDVKNNKPTYRAPYYTPPEPRPTTSEPCTPVSMNDFFPEQPQSQAQSLNHTNNLKDDTSQHLTQKESTIDHKATEVNYIKRNFNTLGLEGEDKKAKKEQTPAKSTGAVPKNSTLNIEVRSSSRNRKEARK